MGLQPTYKDDGCELAASCLDCTIPERDCPILHPMTAKQRERAGRNSHIMELAGRGHKPKALSGMFNVSQRQIQKIVKGK